MPDDTEILYVPGELGDHLVDVRLVALAVYPGAGPARIQAYSAAGSGALIVADAAGLDALAVGGELVADGWVIRGVAADGGATTTLLQR